MHHSPMMSLFPVLMMQHNDPFGVEAADAEPMAPMPTGTLFLTLRGRYHRCLAYYPTYSYVGVIGHGIGGKVIPAKMARIAESQLLE